MEVPPRPDRESERARRNRPSASNDAWSRLRDSTHSKTLPQLLIVFLYGWTILWHRQLTGPSAGVSPAMLPWFVAVCWFSGIVYFRVTAVAPLRPHTLRNWIFRAKLGWKYTYWLGFLPPTSSRGWLQWAVWVLVIVGLVASVTVVAVAWTASP